MCWEMALMAAGQGLSMAGQGKNRAEQMDSGLREVRARNAKLAETREILKGFAAENDVVFDELLGGFGTDPAGAESVLNDTLQRSVVDDPAVFEIPLSERASEVAKKGNARAITEGIQEGRDAAAREAKLGSFGKMLFNNGQQTASAARDVNLVNTFGRERAAMLPELQDLAAMSVRKSPSGVGDLMIAGGNFLGQMGGSMGGGGGMGLGNLFRSATNQPHVLPGAGPTWFQPSAPAYAPSGPSYLTGVY